MIVCRRSGRSIVAPAVLDRLAEVVQRLVQGGAEVHRVPVVVDASHTGVGEQVVDQDLHALGAVDGEVDVLLGPVVQLVAVPLVEQLAEGRDLAQRFLQIVRGDVGELLQLGVGAAQFHGLFVQIGGALREQFLALPRGRQRVQDAHPHRLDGCGELLCLRRSRGLDAMVEVTVRHPLGGPAQGVQRASDGGVQQESQRRGDRHEGGQHAGEEPVVGGAGAVHLAPGRGAFREQVPVQLSELYAQSVEGELALLEFRGHGQGALPGPFHEGFGVCRAPGPGRVLHTGEVGQQLRIAGQRRPQGPAADAASF